MTAALIERLCEVRERLYQKGRDYFIYEHNRFDRTKWGGFWGAIDALHESGNALREYAIAVKAGARTLACYGFLQALYVQQDAVWTLSKAVGLKWHPDHDARLSEIREVRGRLTGHPAEARGPRRGPQTLSSAIIPEHDVTERGFRGHVYFERRIEDVRVDVQIFEADNDEHLARQMIAIEKKMMDDEEAFRAAHRGRPISAPFDLNLSYLVRTLSCDLRHESERIKASGHSQTLRGHMEGLESDLADRGFTNDATKLCLGRIYWALDRIRTITAEEAAAPNAQHEIDVIKIGVERCLRELEEQTRAIDAKIDHTPA